MSKILKAEVSEKKILKDLRGLKKDINKLESGVLELKKKRREKIKKFTEKNEGILKNGGINIVDIRPL